MVVGRTQTVKVETGNALAGEETCGRNIEVHCLCEMLQNIKKMLEGFAQQFQAQNQKRRRSLHGKKFFFSQDCSVNRGVLWKTGHEATFQELHELEALQMHTGSGAHHFTHFQCHPFHGAMQFV